MKKVEANGVVSGFGQWLSRQQRVGQRRWDAEQGEEKKKKWVREIERGFILFFVFINFNYILYYILFINFFFKYEV